MIPKLIARRSFGDVADCHFPATLLTKRYGMLQKCPNGGRLCVAAGGTGTSAALATLFSRSKNFSLLK
jgi:hypothetical protein